MKTLNLKHCFVFIFLSLLAAQANSQSYDYLRILKSFPPLPENTLTASEKEIENYTEKLSVINTLLGDLEDAQNEEIQKAESEPYPFGPNDLDKVDAAQKEIDLLLEQFSRVIEPYTEKDLELHSRDIIILDSVLTINQILIEKLESSNNKNQIYKQLYENRLNSYKELDAENRENIKLLISECEKLAPVINKLDYYTIDGHRVFYNKPGLQLLQQIYKSIEWPFYYNAGNGEKIDPYDWALLMQQMYKDR